MGAVAHLDHHEQLMQHGNDDGREQMVWSNREQEETNAYATTPESRQAGSGTDAQTGGSPVRSSDPRIFNPQETGIHFKEHSGT